MTDEQPVFRRIIVCGSRDGVPLPLPPAIVSAALDAWVHQHMTLATFEQLHVIAGSRRGIDGLALRWAELHALVATCVNAKWRKQGNAAGPIRNRRMLDLFGRVDAVLAFPGGDGTEDMVDAARERHEPLFGAGPRVWRCNWDLISGARHFYWQEHT